MAPAAELLILPFASASLWEQWLSDNHAQPSGIWLKIAKKSSGVASVTYEEALEVALCYGWIDGQRKAFDSTHYLQRLTPRRPRSVWSRSNIERVARLTAAGRMQPAGLAEAEAARQDGRWEAAYDLQTAKSPEARKQRRDTLLAMLE
jgi:uncharacterized protein YdeI (YjbR/CyaY-like superfamily)